MFKKVRKLAFGVGVNDTDYAVAPKINSKVVICPYFRAWHNMLKRCYCRSYQKKQPTYIGCVVCDEWLLFSNFKSWMEGQSWQGKELDKDILQPGNKVYSPDKCMFVTRAINSLLHIRVAGRDRHPQGVYWDKTARRYRAEMTVYGKKRYIGVYATEDAGARAYRAAKAAHIKTIALHQTPRLCAALLRHSEAMSC